MEGDVASGSAGRSYVSNFYPRPPGGGRLTLPLITCALNLFLSTPSGWRATLYHLSFIPTNQNFYPRPPGGGRLLHSFLTSQYFYFYPRPPGGGRPMLNQAFNFVCEFLSTPSGWRATASGSAGRSYVSNFYPRPPGGGRLFHSQTVWAKLTFLSTPSGWRATSGGNGHRARIQNFYPRPPGGGRLTTTDEYKALVDISIHALRVEGDALPPLSCPASLRDFYPRPPGGGRRPSRKCPRIRLRRFLSTPSGWRATATTPISFNIYAFLSTPSGWRATSFCL